MEDLSTRVSRPTSSLTPLRHAFSRKKSQKSANFKTRRQVENLLEALATPDCLPILTKVEIFASNFLKSFLNFFLHGSLNYRKNVKMKP